MFDTYGDSRNRQLLLALWLPENSSLRRYLVEYLRWRWNRDHADKDHPLRQVKKVELIYILRAHAAPWHSAAQA